MKIFFHIFLIDRFKLDIHIHFIALTIIFIFSPVLNRFVPIS